MNDLFQMRPKFWINFWWIWLKFLLFDHLFFKSYQIIVFFFQNLFETPCDLNLFWLEMVKASIFVIVFQFYFCWFRRHRCLIFFGQILPIPIIVVGVYVMAFTREVYRWLSSYYIHNDLFLLISFGK